MAIYGGMRSAKLGQLGAGQWQTHHRQHVVLAVAVDHPRPSITLPINSARIQTDIYMLFACTGRRFATAAVDLPATWKYEDVT
ncbi:hypothetical protein E2562_029737 [Oryza meyeriana var. granulata]|uniref:Uncharacterized protein n=1 Tax=Oryza meyeriana var. granulata TaxID=110450 RepID=A0A6G1ER50_9ORYZ|nr:hypothetical protein E2562_029737 [Oryza meyeriana var. granulata]